MIKTISSKDPEAARVVLLFAAKMLTRVTKCELKMTEKTNIGLNVKQNLGKVFSNIT